MPIKLTEHFTLEELLPKGMDPNDVELRVRANLVTLAENLLEPLRIGLGLPIIVHDAYRDHEHNAAVGGVATSDHGLGAAADFHAAPSSMKHWEDTTRDAFDWLRIHRDGQFGQLIWEDQRAHFGVPGKLWIHVSLRTAKHPGTPSDINRILVCPAPHTYRVWKGWGA